MTKRTRAERQELEMERGIEMENIKNLNKAQKEALIKARSEDVNIRLDTTPHPRTKAGEQPFSTKDKQKRDR